MNKIFVFGHQNPDTDAVSSAVTLSNMYNKINNTDDVVPKMLGELNKETQYVFDFFGVTAPEIINEIGNDQSVFMVDHNEFQQSVTNIENANILRVVDHHRIANFVTKNPLYYRAEPIGSTNTIVYKMYNENGIEIDKKTAGLMLSSIISDTLLFKSPTTTPEDIEIGNLLAPIAGVDIESYGMDMLKAGTDLSDKSPIDILEDDAKTFEFDGHKFRIGQVNTVDFDQVLNNQPALESKMAELNTENDYETFILVVTDIVNSNSKILVIGENIPSVEKAFGAKLTGNTAFLEGVVSRKKQVVPNLEQQF